MTIDKLLQMSKEIEAELTVRYQEYGLTINQVEVLLYFYCSANLDINANASLIDLNKDKRLMSLILRKLEALNYINRYNNPNDKRQKDIELSLSALEICEDLLAIKAEVNDLFELQLTSTQIDVLKQIDHQGLEF